MGHGSESVEFLPPDLQGIPRVTLYLMMALVLAGSQVTVRSILSAACPLWRLWDWIHSMVGPLEVEFYSKFPISTCLLYFFFSSSWEQNKVPPQFAYLPSLHYSTILWTILHNPILHIASKVCFLEHKSHHFSPFLQSCNPSLHPPPSSPLRINHKLLRRACKSFLIWPHLSLHTHPFARMSLATKYRKLN